MGWCLRGVSWTHFNKQETITTSRIDILSQVWASFDVINGFFM